MSIKDRAVLVKYTDRCWIAGAVDRRASEKAEEDFSAKKGTGRYWKRLVPKVALKDRVNIGAEARSFHDEQTLPWLGGGIRILPAANFQDYMAGMRQRQAKAEQAVRKFLADYDGWIEEARRAQGKLFRDSDYPKPEAVAEKFGFEVDVLPLPNVADWRVDLSAEQVAEIRKEAEGRMRDVQREGIEELYARLADVVSRARERLSDPDAVFRDSLIGNIRDMVGLVARLNLSQDAKLEALRAEVEQKLAVHSPAVLRADPTIRAKAAGEARSIIDRMASFMGGAAVAVPASAPARVALKKAQPKEAVGKQRKAIQSKKSAKKGV